MNESDGDLVMSVRNGRREAYDELAAQGWLKTDRTRGTFVSSELPLVAENGTPRRAPPTSLSSVSTLLSTICVMSIRFRVYPNQ